MSKIQGKPFIELVVDTLGDLKTDFLDLVNGSDKTPEFRSLINASAKITDSDKGKVQYVVLETWSKTYTGYLIYNNTYCVLVAFSSNTQALTMLKIDVAKQTFTTVKEYLDINELRRYLEEASEHITSGEIDSGEAQQGEVLFADGDGGAEWGNLTDAIKEGSVDEGDVVQIFGFDSQGNLKKDTMPEGIVVDETIVEDSPNAVAGGAVYDALATKANASETYTKTQVDTALEDKANVDGNYPTMTVGAADNLTPYDEESGVLQQQPFLLQGTGCGNGEQQVDTGALALLKEKQGNSVVVNNYGKALNNTNWADNNSTLTFNDGIATFTATQQYGLIIQGGVEYKQGHKYLGFAEIKTTTATDKIRLRCASGLGDFYSKSTTDWQLIIGQFTYSESTDVNNIQIGDTRTSYWDAVQVKNVGLIDLTQMFGSNDNIPAYLLAHPEDFFRYYQGSLAYNEGTLVNANGRYLKTIGRQQWDEEWEEGSIDQAGDVIAGSAIHSKNLIKVIPNTDYYFKVGTGGYLIIDWFDKDGNNVGYLFGYGRNDHYKAPANAVSMKFAVVSGYGTTYDHDITISIYYEGESGYDQYYPYEELANIDTGTETLRSAGSVKDTKAPDGTITRRVGYVDLGTLNWIHSAGDGGYYYQAVISDMAFAGGGSVKGNAITENHEIVAQNSVAIGQAFITSAGTHEIYFLMPTDTAPTGTLYYELAEPTTEQGTTFSENVAIDDFGSMDFGSDVPQGAELFYAVDYKAFVDSLYNTLDGDATDIVKESELDTKLATLGYVKLTSVSGYDATKTQTLKNVEGTLTWVDDE